MPYVVVMKVKQIVVDRSFLFVVVVACEISYTHTSPLMMMKYTRDGASTYTHKEREVVW